MKRNCLTLIRRHRLLPANMAVYKEECKGNFVYNYMYVGALHGRLLSAFIQFMNNHNSIDN